MDIFENLKEPFVEPLDDPPDDLTDSDPGEDTNFDETQPIDEPKFFLTTITKEHEGHTLHRIEALRDFGNIRAGHIGGWVEKESNLTHAGTCWIYEDAIVMDDACIRDDAQVRDEAIVMDSADIGKKAKILDQAVVCDDALITDQAMLRDYAVVCDDSAVMGHSMILNNGFVRNAVVDDHVCVKDNAVVIDANLTNHAYLCDNAVVDSDVHIGGYSRLDKNSKLYQSNDETLSAPYIRCSLLGIDSFVSEETDVYTPIEVDESIASVILDESDQNLYHVNVFPDVFLNIHPVTIDPRAYCSLFYNEINIDDAPRIEWPVECIGETADIEIFVYNELFEDFSRRFVLRVHIVEKPEAVEPPAEVSLEIGNVMNRNGELAEKTEFDEVYKFTGYVGEELCLEPVLMDERAQWMLVWSGIDVTNTVLKPVGELSNDEFTLKVWDPEDPERYKTYAIIVDIKAPVRPNLGVKTVTTGVEGEKVKRDKKNSSVFYVYLNEPQEINLVPVLEDEDAEFSIMWRDLDVSDGSVSIPHPVENERFVIVIMDPVRSSRRKEYIVYLTQGGTVERD